MEIEDRIIQENCGKRFLGATTAKLKFDPKISAQINAWIKNPSNFLFISSNAGVGKTYLCAALFYYFFGKASSCRYWQERKLLARIRNCIETHGDYIDEISFACDDHVIILDDFGSCGFNDWRKEVWQAFLDYRYQNKLPTIITTNLSIADVKGQFHERFSSRLFAEENLILEFRAENLRGESID